MQKSIYYGVATMVGVVVIVAGVVWLQRSQERTLSDSRTSSITDSSTPTPTPTISGGSTVQNNSNLQIVDEQVGSGDEAVAGKTVEVNYVGTLTDGTKFDASSDHGSTFSFKLGAGQVIKGWDEGVVGMKVGGKRKLTIPPELGYGAAGAPPTIPANATLVFEIELVSVK